jgi:hypothetical protein
LTSPIEMFRNLPFEAICIKLVNSWVADPSLNNLSRNFYLCRSCKVGLRRMCYPCEFITEIKWLAVKPGGYLRRLILIETFLIFDLKLLWNFRYVVLIFPLIFFFVRTSLLLLQPWALQTLWRRSPLAQELMNTILLTLVTL